MKAIALAPVLALALFFLIGAGGTDGRSGLRGTVLVEPASPVCKPQPPCTRPAAHALLRFWHDGRLVAHTRSNAKGRSGSRFGREPTP